VTRALARGRGASIWTAPATFLPDAILQPRRAWLAVLIGYVTAFLPSLALAAGTSLIVPDAGQPEFGARSATTFLLIVGFAPLVETLIMGAVLSLLLRVMPATAAVLVSAAGWGIAHSAAVPVWGLVIWWPFLVFSTLFVTWRQRSWAAGFAVAACTHALQNLGPALALLFAP
jgi:hypothetical protein